VERLHEEVRLRLLRTPAPRPRGVAGPLYRDDVGGQSTDNAPSVFLSYAHEDKDLAQALADGLKTKGMRVWVDENGLLAGDSLIEQISTAVAGVDYFCTLVSPASRDSNWCRK
jgi:hypothetical protein